MRVQFAPLCTLLLIATLVAVPGLAQFENSLSKSPISTRRTVAP